MCVYIYMKIQCVCVYIYMLHTHAIDQNVSRWPAVDSGISLHKLWEDRAGHALHNHLGMGRMEAPSGGQAPSGSQMGCDRLRQVSDRKPVRDNHGFGGFYPG